MSNATNPTAKPGAPLGPRMLTAQAALNLVRDSVFDRLKDKINDRIRRAAGQGYTSVEIGLTAIRCDPRHADILVERMRERGFAAELVVKIEDAPETPAGRRAQATAIKVEWANAVPEP